MTARGPDYADELTATERRTLDALVNEVGRRNGSTEPPGRGSLRAPIATGLAALVIVLAAALVTQLGAASPPPADIPAASATAPARSADAVFQDLAAAAAAAAVPPPATDRAKVAYRQRLDVVISMIDGRPGYCRVAALTIETWEPIEYLYLNADRPDLDRLAVERTEPPAVAFAGCASITLTEDAVPDSFEGDLFAGWEELSYALGAQAPRYSPLRIVEHSPAGKVTQNAVNEFVGRTDSPDRWWVELVQLLASPQPDPSTVVAALEVAADRAAEAPDGTVAPLGPGTDVTGRPGISVRIPYTVDEKLTTAELMFDPDTGALLQLVVNTGVGTEITAFLAIRMQRHR